MTKISSDLAVVRKSKGPVMTQVDEFFKMGPGPSRTHTMSPMRISYDFYLGLVLTFAQCLANRHRPTWLRFVLVPGLTDDCDDIAISQPSQSGPGNVSMFSRFIRWADTSGKHLASSTSLRILNRRRRRNRESGCAVSICGTGSLLAAKRLRTPSAWLSSRRVPVHSAEGS